MVVDVGGLVAVLLGAGTLTGVAAIIRALTHRREIHTNDIEQTVLMLERMLSNRAVEADQNRDRADRLLEQLRDTENKLGDCRVLLRAYRQRHGDLTDPNLPTPP